LKIALLLVISRRKLWGNQDDSWEGTNGATIRTMKILESFQAMYRFSGEEKGVSVYLDKKLDQSERERESDLSSVVPKSMPENLHKCHRPVQI